MKIKQAAYYLSVIFISNYIICVYVVHMYAYDKRVKNYYQYTIWMNNVFVPLLSNLCIFAIFIFIIFHVVFVAFFPPIPSMCNCHMRAQAGDVGGSSSSAYYSFLVVVVLVGAALPCVSHLLLFSGIVWYFVGATENALFYLHFYYIFFFFIHSFALVCSWLLLRQYIRTSGNR